MTQLGPYTVHPLADAFPLLQGEEFDALVESVLHYGLQEPIVLTADEKTLVDGRNRYLACEAATVDVVFRTLDKIYEGKLLLDYILAANVHRRQLTQQGRRNLAATVVRLDASRSDRQIAREVGVSATTVGAIRKELEGSGDVSRLDTRTDTKGRKQPARKPKPPPEPKPTVAPEEAAPIAVGTPANAAYAIREAVRAIPRLEPLPPDTSPFAVTMIEESIRALGAYTRHLKDRLDTMRAARAQEGQTTLDGEAGTLL